MSTVLSLSSPVLFPFSSTLPCLMCIGLTLVGIWVPSAFKYLKRLWKHKCKDLRPFQQVPQVGREGKNAADVNTVVVSQCIMCLMRTAS